MPTKNIIELEAVSKSYRMGDAEVHALKSVSLTLRPGEIIALEGPSGSGKSTLLNICGLIDQLDAGRYRLQGEDVLSMNTRQRTLYRRKHVGFVFQSFNLVPVMTAYENVEYPLLLNGDSSQQRKKSVDEILERVGLKDFRSHIPDRLSGGQRQRVAIARALVKKPKLIIADEPTANLDTHTAAGIVDMMKALSDETHATFLIATHDERMANHCDRTVRLIDGRIACDS